MVPVFQYQLYFVITIDIYKIIISTFLNLLLADFVVNLTAV